MKIRTCGGRLYSGYQPRKTGRRKSSYKRKEREIKMANFYFNRPVRICDIISINCEDCPLGHILDNSTNCPEFECTKDAENFLYCISRTANKAMNQMIETTNGKEG